MSNDKDLFWCYIKQIMNVFSFVQWNKYFHSVKDENICTIALINIHYLYMNLPRLKTGRFQPVDGQFTITANVGDSVNLGVTVRGYPPGKLRPTTDIRWQKQSDTRSGFQTFTDNSDTTFTINSVTIGDSGVYATYWKGKRTEFRFSLIRLIVRGRLN